MERDTTGILMWEEIFLVETPDGREVAVALVDTQGSFDKNSTVRDCATIFALSLMTSSVLVYNLFNNIQEDDLQHLHYFTEYGRLALEGEDGHPFQKLQYLVRDWQFPYEYPYGAAGGAEVLQKQIKVEEKQHPELQALRKGLVSCFSDMSNFLLPHPGRNVATNPHFKGDISKIDEEFLEHLQDLMKSLLHPRNLVVKAMGGKEVKAKELAQYYRSYMEIFKGNTMPEPKSMLEVTIEANNLVSLASAKELYMASMESLCGGDRPYLNEQVLDLEHGRILEAALVEFDSRKKLGGDEFSAKYREQLMEEMDEGFNNFKVIIGYFPLLHLCTSAPHHHCTTAPLFLFSSDAPSLCSFASPLLCLSALFLIFSAPLLHNETTPQSHNDSKNIFKAANTPITIFIMWSVLYIFSQVSSLLMLYPLANLANLLMWGLTFLGATWAYAKYSGEFSGVGVQIEELTGKVWDNCFQPLLNKAVEHGSEAVVKSAVSRMNSVSATSSPHPGARRLPSTVSSPMEGKKTR